MKNLQMRKYWHTAVVAAAVISSASPLFCATLVENGRPKAVLVVPARAESKPAATLQRYIEMATGARLPILTEEQLSGATTSDTRVFVGAGRTAGKVVDVQKLQPEGFVIKTVGDDLYIVGRDATDAGMRVEGTFYGVCEFLERYLGVRWLMPGPLGEVVPKHRSLTIATADIRQEPLLWQRKIRNKVPAANPWFDHQRMGSRVRIAYGHAFSGWWDRYHEQYPDIFALQPNGTRINTNVRERLCVSNPKLWELAAADRIAELRANPGLTGASIAPNDGGGGNKFCSCETCRSWDSPEAQAMYAEDPNLNPGPGGGGPYPPLTDRYFRFYNEVARRVKEEMPDRYLGCYAYSLYRTPPVRLDRLEDNLVVGYVGFTTSYINDEERASSREEWRQWSRLARQIFLRPNQLLGPIGFPINWNRKMAEDLRYMADNGLRATDYDNCVGNWGTQGLHYYVLAKLLWDPYAAVEPMVADYCRAAYGAGAGAMEDYYRKLEALCDYVAARTVEKDAPGGWRNLDLIRFTELYTENPIFPTLHDSIDRAKAAIGTRDPAALQRVQLVAAGLEYAGQARRALAAAGALRAGAMSVAEFDRIIAGTDAYFATLEGGMVVPPQHDTNVPRIRRTLRAVRTEADLPADGDDVRN
jgi:hypothetical protein